MIDLSFEVEGDRIPLDYGYLPSFRPCRGWCRGSTATFELVSTRSEASAVSLAC